MRTIAANAGLRASSLVHEARRRAAGGAPERVFDVLQRRWVDGWSGRIVDPLTVPLTALETSVSTVGPVLTSEVLVRRSKPPTALNP